MDNVFDELDFIEIDEELMEDIHTREREADTMKATFIRDAKDQSLEYFHSLNRGLID